MLSWLDFYPVKVQHGTFKLFVKFLYVVSCFAQKVGFGVNLDFLAYFFNCFVLSTYGFYTFLGTRSLDLVIIDRLVAITFKFPKLDWQVFEVNCFFLISG